MATVLKKSAPRSASKSVINQLDVGRKTRLNLVYRGGEVELLLEKLQRLGSHGTVTETVARALRVYEALLDEREKGNVVIVRDKHGAAILRLI